MMNADQVYCVFDYETLSEAPLDEVGAWEYSIHNSTGIRCAAGRIGTRKELPNAKTMLWIPSEGHSPRWLKDVLFNPEIIMVAHNALFEQFITRNVLSRYSKNLDRIPTDRWLCTASLAAAMALPRKLEGVGAALGLPIQKDKEGKKLIRAHCIPQEFTKKQLLEIRNFGGLENPHFKQIDANRYWNNDPEGIKRLARYCVTDVDVETEVFLRLPPLSPRERRVWALDQKMNTRGLYVDRQLVTTVQKMVEVESGNLRKEAQELTLGVLDNATQRDAMLEWLRGEGLSLPDLQAKTIADTLSSGLATGAAKRLLEIRQAVSKTSLGKYPALEQRTRFDSRLRDLMIYHGASTGRFTATGAQIHNVPRGKISDMDLACEILLTGDLKWVEALLGDPMAAFSGCLRGCLCATPGDLLHSGDYAAIEARFVFWLARHESGLDVFRKGDAWRPKFEGDVNPYDPYKIMATRIYGVPYAEVTKDMREVGKRAVLGCGFGMGHKKFRETCAQFGIVISEELAKKAVDAYREMNPPVVQLWSNLERAAIAAVKEPRKRFKINRTTWFMEGKTLFCELPSGRRIAYYGATLRTGTTPWGEKRPVLHHWDVHPKTKQWVEVGTYGGRLAENGTQGGARDVMVDNMMRVEDAGFHVLMTVHDEIVAEREGDHLPEFLRLMSGVPFWAEGLPVKVEGWSGLRYRK